MPRLPVLLQQWVRREGVERIRPLADVHGPITPGFDDKNRRPLGQRGRRPRDVGLGTAPDLDQHFTRAGGASRRYDENPDAADERGLPSHRQLLLMPRRLDAPSMPTPKR